jgi:hypothetical protein
MVHVLYHDRTLLPAAIPLNLLESHNYESGIFLERILAIIKSAYDQKLFKNRLEKSSEE